MDAKTLLRRGDKCIRVHCTDMGKWLREPVTVADELHRAFTFIDSPPQKMGEALRGNGPNGPGVEKVYVNVVTDTGKTEPVCEDDLEATDE